MSQPLSGRLLVATPKLVDPNFHRAVVLLLSHDDAGSFGVVLNRPLPAPLGEVLPGWQVSASEPAVVFLGGPVEQRRALGLARCCAPVSGDAWTPLSQDIGLVDLTGSPHDVEDGLEELRVFTGYAGWGEGQLEAEIAEDAWFVVDARPGDVFSQDPGTLWRDVLLRQHGRIAMYAFYPGEPGLN